MVEAHGDDIVRLLAEVVRGLFNDRYPRGFTISVDAVGRLVNMPQESMKITRYARDEGNEHLFAAQGVQLSVVDVLDDSIPNYPLLFPAFQFTPCEPKEVCYARRG